jgi:crotonobetainyl-CoA:carnitine CoA-transferase CaiB-like acyl-CoA transferase
MATGALDGIRVIDFASFIAGPFAAMLLGDLGADVIKVEPPSGDLARAWSPFLRGESRYFQAWNRNKRGIVADLTTPGGRTIAHALVRSADIVIENFRSGVAARLGIDYETLREINPRVIYCSSNAFGSRGPRRDRPGYDPVLQTVAGVALANARINGGTPAVTAAPVADYQAAMQIVAGALAALLYRERTGEGQKVETSLLHAVMAVMSHHFVKPLDCQEEGPVGIYPYRMLRTRDGVIFIAAATDKFWRMLCEAVDAADLAAEPRFATNAGRVAAAGEITPRLEAYLSAKTTAEWERIFLDRGLPCGAPATCAEFFEDPQVEAMAMNPVVEHTVSGRMRMIGVPIEMEKSPGSIRRPAPRLGEHTAEVLAEIGL